MPALKIMHFSDVLCVWAHVGQANIAKLVKKFDDRVEVEVHFCSIFPDTQTKINKAWQDRGGFTGYAAHVKEVAGRFDNVNIHDDVWAKVQPKSSASPHLFIKAVALLEDNGPEAGFFDRLSNRAAMELRTAFFTQAKDISDWSVQRAVSEKIGVDFDAVQKKIETGEAIAKLAADYELGQALHVQGSPTYILSEGRQILFGNISYGILEANVSELLSERRTESGSIC
uniref:DsbA family oxidoreductase n=4 Tax=Yoonia sp. TaxID=2212373 RepID=UPI0040488E85|tara:strand:- start:33782 stop:34465 length:684 start_codon:yes stop_codon:yes gene_type:complete